MMACQQTSIPANKCDIMPACQYDIMPAIHHRDKTLDSHQGFIGWRKTPDQVIVGVRMEGGKKSEGVSQAKKRELKLTGYVTGIASMEDDSNSLNFFGCFPSTGTKLGGPNHQIPPPLPMSIYRPDPATAAPIPTPAKLLSVASEAAI